MRSPGAEKGPVTAAAPQREEAQPSMSIPGVLLAVPLLLLQGGFPGAASDSVALKEGENLNLHCTFSTLSTNSTLQWLNPDGFTVFFNAQRVLRDQRYKLLRYSKDELSIQLSNVTVQDEGIYNCLYYSKHVQSKSQNVEILAAPSHPVLETSQDAERGIKLSCYTQGCKPQPQISWLLDNGVELPGDTRHQLGADGKKWSSSSTLRMLSYSPKVTASCIIRHPALGGERLVASLHFQDLPSTGCQQPNRPPEDAKAPSPSENPPVSSSPENPAGTSPSESPKDPEVPSPSASPIDTVFPSPSASPEDPEVLSPSASPIDPEVCNLSASPIDPEVPSPSASPENPEVSSLSSAQTGSDVQSSSPSPQDPDVPSPSASPQNPEVSSPPASPPDPAGPSSAPTPAQPNATNVTSNGSEETTTTTTTTTAEELGGSSSPGGFNGTQTAASGNSTEEESPKIEVPAHENITVISTLTLEQNPQAKGMVKKERNLLLPILVAALIFVLLIIVLLFMVKLKKAHGVWKRENDVSEQTLESYKSRSNEDSPGHEKNGHAVNPKSNMQYVTEEQVQPPEKNPETPEKNPADKNVPISEEMLKCGRETDV